MTTFSIEEFSTRLDALRDAQSPLSGNLLEKFKKRIDAVEDFRLFGVAITVIGAALAALSRLFDGNLGLGMAVAGVTGSVVAGIAVALLDRRKLEISSEATNAIANAAAALTLVDDVKTALSNLFNITEQFDRKRRERLSAIEKMLHSVEASLLTDGVGASQAAQTLLSSAIQQVRASVDYEGGDFFTVTIFRREMVDGVERMVRIAAEWTDPMLAKAGGRSWDLGMGYTGVAWSRSKTNPNGDVVIADTSTPEVLTQYPVTDRDPDREQLYRSIAAIPILIKSTNEVWGVVTATTDRCGVFDRDSANIKVQNVDVIRDIARVAALLASLERGVA